MKNFVFGLALISVFVISGCQEQASALKSYPVHVSLSSYAVAKVGPLDFIFPKAYAAISSVKFCFKRLRFKRLLPHDAPDTSADNIDLSLGELDIAASGTALTTISVPADTYKRVEFDLEPNCVNPGDNSVTLVNDNGSFSSASTITIKFDGTFVVSGEEALNLDVQNILDAANSFDGMGGVSLKEALEAVSGNL